MTKRYEVELLPSEHEDFKKKTDQNVTEVLLLRIAVAVERILAILEGGK